MKKYSLEYKVLFLNLVNLSSFPAAIADVGSISPALTLSMHRVSVVYLSFICSVCQQRISKTTSF